jgi:hypothetical protein
MSLQQIRSESQLQGIVPASLLGAQSLAASGYMYVGGLLIQWGQYTGGANSPTVTFPVEFTTLYSLTGNVKGPANDLNGRMLDINTVTNSNFIGNQRRHDSATLTDNFYWFAVGV